MSGDVQMNQTVSFLFEDGLRFEVCDGQTTTMTIGT